MQERQKATHDLSTRRQWRLSRGIGVMALTLCWGGIVEAGQVRAMSLDDLVHRADRVFSGRCLRVEPFRHPELGVEASRVTFEVESTVKGSLGRTVTVQVLGAPPKSALDSSASSDGPRFVPGERVVLFLYPESMLGFTSPVGLGQGKFEVFRDKEGRDVAVNALRKSEAMSVSSLLDATRAAVLREIEGRAVPRGSRLSRGGGRP